MKKHVDRLRELHDEWFEVLNLFARTNLQTAIPKPNFKVFAGPSVWAGRYRIKPHCCFYALSYFLLYEDYSETVAHEMCHAFQRGIDPQCGWHGELFRLLIRHVCGFKAHVSTHSYSVKKAKALGEVLKLQAQLQPTDRVYT